MTTRSPQGHIYQVGGSLPPTAKSYVKRQADDLLYQALQQRELCYVLTARQMGKSSLRVRTMHRLQQAGIHCGVLDMTLLGTRQLTMAQWYMSIIRRLIRVFDLPTDFRRWWSARDQLSPVQCLAEFLEDELLGYISSPIVLFIDEIDAILQLDFSTDDFFSLLRACYNSRAEHSVYQRLTFALIGVATPSDLIADPLSTPFNIGRSIAVNGFDSAEVQPLLSGLTRIGLNAPEVLSNVLVWTGGQPFLTQKVCQLIDSYGQKEKKLNGDSDYSSLIGDSDHSIDVADLVRSNIIDNWEVQDHPEHLKTVRDRLFSNPHLTGRVLGIYQQLLAGESILTDESRSQITLRLSGIVIDYQGQLKIANPIYRAVFNERWVANQLAELRPYGVALRAWSDSNCQNDQYLLTGLDLQAALTWVESKQLSEVDYRFLSASQAAAKEAVESELVNETAEKEKAEFALQAATEAVEILARARKTARTQISSFRLIKKRLVGIALGVSSLVVLGRWSGGLQGLEWGLLDHFFQWRPVAAVDSRIVIITIDEPDIQSIGQFPIPDGVLAQALNNIEQFQPRLIGLDIYRDLPVEPGHRALVDVFQKMRNLIAIEKAVGTEISAPPTLANTDRVGFADQLLDKDGTVRRTLLAIETDSTEDIKFSFSLKLTLAYLEHADSELEAYDLEAYLDDAAIEHLSIPLRMNQPISLGNTILRPFQAYDGGYARADAGGYQTLLNYTGTQSQFLTFSLSQVLANEVPESAIRDRIVLLGSSASTLLTPYTKRSNGYMAGVTIHANVISMLLQAALDNRSLLRVWSEPVEIAWIFLWVGMATLLSGKWLRLPGIAVAAIAAVVVMLTGSAYALFLSGWWVPLASTAVGMVLAAIAVPIVTGKKLERVILAQIVHLLSEFALTKPAAGKIAIAYLKQSENTENQDLIDDTVQKIALQRQSSDQVE